MNIELMAKLYLAGRVINGTGGNLNVKEFRELGMDAFIAGANAVLKEVEQYADMQDGCYALECIQLKISELKGDEK